MAPGHIRFVQPATGTLASEVNVTPMVDIVLVLLIIFMTVSPLRDGALEAGEAEEGGAVVRLVEVEIDPAGIFRIGGQEASSAELPEAIRAALQSLGARAVLVNAAPASPYPSVIRALDAARLGGAEVLGLPDVQP